MASLGVGTKVLKFGHLEFEMYPPRKDCNKLIEVGIDYWACCEGDQTEYGELDFEAAKELHAALGEWLKRCAEVDA